MQQIKEGMFRHEKIDFWYLAAVLFLTVYGLVMISSASAIISYENFGNTDYYIWQQLRSIVIGLIAMYVFSKVHYRLWWKMALPVIFFTVALLGLVYVPGIGSASGTGAYSWIHIQGLPSIQPAEFAKVGLLVFLASVFSGDRRMGANPQFLFIGGGLATLSFLLTVVFGIGILAAILAMAAVYFIHLYGGDAKKLYEGLFVFLAVIAAVVGLVAGQPDWGTAMIIVLASGGLFWVAGARFKYLAILASMGVAVLIPVLMTKQYIADRFASFLNPSADVLGAGYHLYQSLLAIGSGGFWGLGYGYSRQKFEYLPEAYGDSIFAIISEEMGFIGVAVMLAAFVILSYRGFKIAYGAQDRFSALLAAGITSWFIVQALINMMVNVGMLPNTGVPIPFISFGGSSIMAVLIGAGIMLNISRYSKMDEDINANLFHFRDVKRWLMARRRR